MPNIKRILQKKKKKKRGNKGDCNPITKSKQQDLLTDVVDEDRGLGLFDR